MHCAPKRSNFMCPPEAGWCLPSRLARTLSLKASPCLITTAILQKAPCWLQILVSKHASRGPSTSAAVLAVIQGSSSCICIVWNQVLGTLIALAPSARQTTFCSCGVHRYHFQHNAPMDASGALKAGIAPCPTCS